MSDSDNLENAVRLILDSHKRYQDNQGRIIKAVRDYHYDLDMRANGDLAAHKLAKQIEEILNMPWSQGAEKRARESLIRFRCETQ